MGRPRAASNGSFSISFWMKPSTTGNPGSLFGYILSIAAGSTRTSPTTGDAYAANNINIYMPQQEHNVYGMVSLLLYRLNSCLSA